MYSIFSRPGTSLLAYVSNGTSAQAINSEQIKAINRLLNESFRDGHLYIKDGNRISDILLMEYCNYDA